MSTSTIRRERLTNGIRHDDWVTRRGDVWLLGRHRLVCGSGDDAGNIANALNGARYALHWERRLYEPEVDVAVVPEDGFQRTVMAAILNETKRGEVALAIPGGGGRTLLAAEMLGRVCCAVEPGPWQCDNAVLRWQYMTGQEATHEVCGRTFTQVATMRLGPDASRALPLRAA